MRKVPTEVVGDAHAYTRSDVPWSLSTGKTGRARMIDYISGGGMRTFGRTVRQEEACRKQRRFLVAFAAIAAAWLLLLIF